MNIHHISMSVQTVTYKKKLADGTVKEYKYEREIKSRAISSTGGSRTRPVSKKVLAEIVKNFSTDQLSKVIEYARELSAPTDSSKNTPENVSDVQVSSEKSEKKSSGSSEEQ